MSGFTVTVIGAQRANNYRHKNDRGWSGALSIPTPTEDQLAMLTQGTEDDMLQALREHHPWLGGGHITGITWED